MSDNRFRPTVVQGIVVVGSVLVLSFFWNLLLEYLQRDKPDLQQSALTRMVPISLVTFVYATWFAIKQKKAKGG